MNKKYILTKSYDIEKLLQNKSSIGSKYYVIYYTKNQNGDTNVAISASKKIGNAVTRNYNKRVTREIIRENFDQIKGFKMLIVLKASSTTLSYEQKVEQIAYIIKKLHDKEKN